jgi:hypothetical protein
MFFRACVVAVLLVLFAPSSALAAEPGSHRWYGGQTLAVDGAAVALLVAGGLSERSFAVLAGLSAATYLIGAPLVHVAHGEGTRGGGSFMIRVGAPLLGAVIATEAIRSEPESCKYQGESTDCQEDRHHQGFAGMLIGSAVGAFAATVIDAAALAWKPPVTIAPQVSADRFTLSVVGTF